MTESPEEKVQQLQRLNAELSDSLRKLTNFQKQVLAIRNSASIDEALDQMELLLDQAVEFAFVRLYLRDAEGEFVKDREMCPDDLELDWSLVTWACEHQELTVIPLEDGREDDIASVLLLPFVGAGGPVGILALWLETDPTAVTQEQTTLLTMLARETGSVIETHQFRERIERTRAVISDVVESVPHGLLSLDRNRCISVINSTLEILFNVRRDEAIGSTYRDALPADVTRTLDQLLDETPDDELELSISIQGVEQAFGFTLTPMHGDNGDEPAGYVVVCRDLQMTRELQKLRELDAMKNDFLSLVSHELRTPLTSIMAYSETLLMEGMVDTEEERKEYLEIIYSEGGRLSRLINDVLDLTKMEAGKMDYNYEEQNVNDVCKIAIANSSSLSTPKGIELISEFADDLPLARLDSDRVMQVLMNLLSNAIKFTDEGSVTLRTSAATDEQSRPTVRIAVIDTGVGIAPENLDRVFSKFEQIENIDHHHVGTGLGMPICKQIVEEGHGGNIWIESTVGEGTGIFFDLPAVVEDES